LGSWAARWRIGSSEPVSASSAGTSRTSAAGALRERGGEVAHAAQEVFSGCSRVLLTLPSHREVGDVVRAAGTTLSRGLTIIDTTTGDPASTEALARTMDEQGIVYLDATISGSSAQVRAGAATLMVGGDAESFAACSDIFALTSGATRRGSSTRRSSPNPRSCKDAWSSQRGTGSSPRTRYRSPHGRQKSGDRDGRSSSAIRKRWVSGWWHSRDYGVIVANGFGKRAMPASPDGKLVVKAGDSLKLRYDVLLFDTPASAPIDFAAAYRRVQSDLSAPR
jgi:hypothetical protein